MNINFSTITPDQLEMDIVDPEALQHMLDVLKTVRLVCMTIYAPIICFLGIIANILNIIVLTRRGMVSSTNVYLSAVAVGDTLYLVFFYIFSLILYPSTKYSAIYMYSFPIVRCTANVCSNTTTWLTMTFTIERYIAVCHPMLRHKICTIHRARWIVAIVTLICFLTTFPDYLKFGTAAKIDPDNITYYEAEDTEMAVTLSLYGYAYVNQTLYIFIPFFLLLIFNILLIRSVVRANKLRKQTLQVKTASTTLTNRRSRPQNEQQRITIMLIVVVVAFLVLQCPSSVNLLIDSVRLSKGVDYTPIEKARNGIFGNFINVFLLTSAALNFVLYSLFSIKFRQTFKVLFQCQNSDGDAVMKNSVVSTNYCGTRQLTQNENNSSKSSADRKMISKSKSGGKRSMARGGRFFTSENNFRDEVVGGSELQIRERRISGDGGGIGKNTNQADTRGSSELEESPVGQVSSDSDMFSDGQRGRETGPWT